jgi:hypothetical protein
MIQNLSANLHSILLTLLFCSLISCSKGNKSTSLFTRPLRKTEDNSNSLKTTSPVQAHSPLVSLAIKYLSARERIQASELMQMTDPILLKLFPDEVKKLLGQFSGSWKLESQKNKSIEYKKTHFMVSFRKIPGEYNALSKRISEDLNIEEIIHLEMITLFKGSNGGRSDKARLLCVERDNGLFLIYHPLFNDKDIAGNHWKYLMEFEKIEHKVIEDRTYEFKD